MCTAVYSSIVKKHGDELCDEPQQGMLPYPIKHTQLTIARIGEESSFKSMGNHTDQMENPGYCTLHGSEG